MLARLDRVVLLARLDRVVLLARLDRVGQGSVASSA